MGNGLNPKLKIQSLSNGERENGNVPGMESEHNTKRENAMKFCSENIPGTFPNDKMHGFWGQKWDLERVCTDILVSFPVKFQ